MIETRARTSIAEDGGRDHQEGGRVMRPPRAAQRRLSIDERPPDQGPGRNRYGEDHRAPGQNAVEEVLVHRPRSVKRIDPWI